MRLLCLALMFTASVSIASAQQQLLNIPVTDTLPGPATRTAGRPSSSSEEEEFIRPSRPGVADFFNGTR